jgi:hypothetical protein
MTKMVLKKRASFSIQGTKFLTPKKSILPVEFRPLLGGGFFIHNHQWLVMTNKIVTDGTVRERFVIGRPDDSHSPV